MEGLLTEVSTSYNQTDAIKEDFLIEVRDESKFVKAPRLSEASPKSAQDALDGLRSEPSINALVSILHYLSVEQSASGTKLTVPNAINSQIVNVLVSETIPTYWDVLSKEEVSKQQKLKNTSQNWPTGKGLVVRCLQNVPSLNAIILRLRALIRQAKESKKNDGSVALVRIRELLSGLDAILKDSGTIYSMYSDIRSLGQGPKEQILWKELMTIVGSGRILDTAAEATQILNSSSGHIEESRWIADGTLYSQWLGQSISQWAKEACLSADEQWKHLAELVKRCLRLGYADALLKELFLSLILYSDEPARFEALQKQLPRTEHKNILYAALRFLSSRLRSTPGYSESPNWWQEDATLVGASGKFLNIVLDQEESRRDYLVSWLTTATGAGVGESIGIRRTVVAVILQFRSSLEDALEKSMQQFGEKLYINHAPTLQQEVHAQVLLLLAGCVSRVSSMRLSMLVRSGVHLNAVSNRLASSSTRARFLGMIVGQAMSSLVDSPDKQMKFGIPDMETPEAQWYMSLVKVQDTIGTLEHLRSPVLKDVTIGLKPHRREKISTRNDPVSARTSKIVAITEVSDDDTEEELQPYTKIDSDAEDSDDDPTLVRRNKPSAPVYIRDLITYLRDMDSYDRQKLALMTAPSLIRRKANFGTEVSAHVEELATLLVGLQDKYEIEGFQELRIQGMMAALVAQPRNMGAWFCRTFFEGDYSISQRATVLTTIGLAARELAGYKDSDTLLTTNTKSALPTATDFPSKMLPPKMHAIYNPQPQTKQLTPVDSLSRQLSDMMIEPLAASIAEAASGPSILKVRSTTELNKTPRPTIPRAKSNTFLPLAGGSFFFPLSARTFLALRSTSGRAQVILSPFLLSTLLKTLALILHAAGPACPDLPQMTSEFWDLLLALRARAAAELNSLEALCFSLLTLLQINAVENKDRRRLAERHGPQLIETQAWVTGMLRMLGDGEEEEKVRVLAAGILVGISEIVEKYQRLLMGDLASVQGPVW